MKIPTKYKHYKLKPSRHLIDIEVSTVKRHWLIRLLTLTPFRSHKAKIKRIPSATIYIHGNILILHPTMVNQLSKERIRDFGRILL